LIYDGLHDFAPSLEFLLQLLEFLWNSKADQGTCTDFEGVSFVEEQLFYNLVSCLIGK
jgi:hypothetical protein